MAKEPTTTAAAPKKVKVGGFEFETGLSVPPMTRGGTRSSETADKLKAMPVGASFLEPVEVPESIKDSDERAKVFKEKARTVSNRLSGAIRRFKKNNPGFEFNMRTVNDDSMGHGVRVWRIEDTATNGKAAASS
tara:strand:+ start:384 stop:785 length:402 start_codon:yes stop_codon:yes gene_type:complete